MAIKYKIVQKNKEDIRDSIISKTGHYVLFTIRQMEDNERSLRDTAKKAEGVIETFNNYLEKLKNPSEYTEEQQHTAVMYYEAMMDKETFEKQLEDPKITEKEIKERKAMIEHRSAVMENIAHFHEFVTKFSFDELKDIAEYRKTIMLRQQYEDKLKEITDTLARSDVEKAEIIKQTKIKL